MGQLGSVMCKLQLASPMVDQVHALRVQRDRDPRSYR